MRFWADKNNIAKHLVRAIKTGKGAVGHGTGLRNEFYRNSAATTNTERDILKRTDTVTVQLEEYYPYFRKYNGRIIETITERIYDSVVRIYEVDLVEKLIRQKNKNILEKKRAEFNEK